MWRLLGLPVDLLLFAGWMTILGVLPFATASGLSILLLDWPSGWRGSSLSGMFVGMTVMAAQSAFIVAFIAWGARLSSLISRRFELDNTFRLAFLGIAIGYSVPTLLALLAAGLEAGFVLAGITIALFLLTAWFMIPFTAWGIRIYAQSVRPFISRWSPLVMPALPQAVAD